jgi:hypothetical protein
LNARQEEVFLRDFAVKMVTDGMSPPHFFGGLISFDETISHTATRLRAPVEWIEEYGREFYIYSDSRTPSLHLRNNIVWANAAWLFSENEEPRLMQ